MGKFPNQINMIIPGYSEGVMGVKKSLKTRAIPRFLISGLAILFVLSLSLHNHAFYYGTFSFTKKICQAESSYPSHSKDFCSACRLDGDIKSQDIVNNLNSLLGTLVFYLGSDVLIPSSFLIQNKSSRSPPIV